MQPSQRGRYRHRESVPKSSVPTVLLQRPTEKKARRTLNKPKEHYQYILSIGSEVQLLRKQRFYLSKPGTWISIQHSIQPLLLTGAYEITKYDKNNWTIKHKHSTSKMVYNLVSRDQRKTEYSDTAHWRFIADVTSAKSIMIYFKRGRTALSSSLKIFFALVKRRLWSGDF